MRARPIIRPYVYTNANAYTNTFANSNANANTHANANKYPQSDAIPHTTTHVIIGGFRQRCMRWGQYF